MSKKCFLLLVTTIMVFVLIFNDNVVTSKRTKKNKKERESVKKKKKSPSPVISNAPPVECEMNADGTWSGEGCQEFMAQATNMYQTNITNAPGLPFFLRKRWVSRKERISITPQLQKKITRTNDYETTRGVIVKPGHCCCRINSQIDVIVHEDKNESDKENGESKENDDN